MPQRLPDSHEHGTLPTDTGMTVDRPTMLQDVLVHNLPPLATANEVDRLVAAIDALTAAVERLHAVMAAAPESWWRKRGR